MLVVRNLTRVGLAPASFTLDDGECIAVRGASGSGKTLLLRAIADLDPNEAIGHQCNALILGPGGYRFSDYWRMGLPLELLIVILGTPLILYFWPL